MNETCPRCGSARTPYKNSNEYVCGSLTSRHGGKFLQSWDCVRNERDKLLAENAKLRKQLADFREWLFREASLGTYFDGGNDSLDLALEEFDAITKGQ